MFTKFSLVAGAAFIGLSTSPAAAQQVCTSVPGYNNSVPGMAPGPYSLACGTATAYGEASTAVGQLANAPVSGGVAVGYDAVALGVNGVALGQGSNAVSQNSVSIGQGSWANGTNSVAVGPGAANNTFSNSVAIGAWTQNTAANQVAVGNRTVSGVNAGAVSAVSTDAVNGAQLFATNNEVAGLQAGLSTTNTQVTGLQSGLSATNTQMAGLQSGLSVTNTQVAGLQSGLAATNNQLAGLQSGMSALDLRIEALEQIAFDLDAGFQRVDRKIDGSTAVAIAMSGNAFLPDKKVNITGNVGSYRGAWAGALQAAVIVSPSTAFNAAIAKNFNRRGGVGTRAGFTFGW